MTLPLRDLEGKYEILHKIREGGMGAIYKVRHRLLDEVRVIKVIRPQIAGESGLQERFLREARAAIRLRHPNLAQLYDFAVDQDGTTSYMVLEHIEGVALDELLRAAGPPGLGLALEVAEQGLTAIDYLHRCGYIHRDLSPDNLMLSRGLEGQPLVKLLDLGIIKRIGAVDQLTQTGMFVGKLRYTSPEQLGGRPQEGPDRRSDLYSFGIVLYELLTGVCPIAGDSLSELVSSHLVQGPLAFERSDPRGEVPEPLRRLVLRLLARQPEDRPASAAEVVEALRELPHPKPAQLRRQLDRVFEEVAESTAVEYTETGSTQDRLDARFAPGATPPPEPAPGWAAEVAGVAERMADARLFVRLDQPQLAVRELVRVLEADPAHAEAAELLAGLGGARPAAPRSAARSVRPAAIGNEDLTAPAGEIDDLLESARRRFAVLPQEAAPPTLLVDGGRPGARGGEAADGAERAEDAARPGAGEPGDDLLVQARRSISAALDMGHLRRAEQELAFACAHYGLADQLADLRARFDHLDAGRRALAAFDPPASAAPAAPAHPVARRVEAMLARLRRRP